MEALPSLTTKPHLLFHPRLPSFSTPPPSLSFSTPPSSLSIRASHSSSSSPFSPLKLPLTAAITAAALLASRLSPFRPLPAFAEPQLTETLNKQQSQTQENPQVAAVEAHLESALISNPNDVESLKSLLEIKMKARKLPEVIDIATRLALIEPDELEWNLLRGHTFCYMGDYASAKPIFEQILSGDPNRVEAYHGLVMSATQLDEDNGQELGEVEKRISEAIDRLKKEKKRVEIRDFYLLVAQIRVIQGEYMAALNVYQDLVKDEPRDYRPYLCQGIIYTLLRKKKEAEEQFQKYKRLVPKEHPYAEYFAENVKDTAKVFSEAVEDK